MQHKLMTLSLCQTNYSTEVISLSAETVANRFRCYNLKALHHHHIYSHRLRNNILYIMYQYIYDICLLNFMCLAAVVC
jgi:hypothetical protein